MMENFIRRLHPGSAGQVNAQEEIRLAAHEVARPIVFGIAIIIAVYLPSSRWKAWRGECSVPWPSPSAQPSSDR